LTTNNYDINYYERLFLDNCKKEDLSYLSHEQLEKFYRKTNNIKKEYLIYKRWINITIVGFMFEKYNKEQCKLIYDNGFREYIYNIHNYWPTSIKAISNTAIKYRDFLYNNIGECKGFNVDQAHYFTPNHLGKIFPIRDNRYYDVK
jgi:hypothetical protein